MTAMSDYLESSLLQHLFRTATFTKPTTLAIALCSAAVSDSDTGALTNKELANSGAYARQSLNPLDANWNNVSAGNGTVTNASTITFPTASADWGTVSYIAICDSASFGSGQMLFYGALTSSKVVSSGDTFSMSSTTGISLQIDN